MKGHTAFVPNKKLILHFDVDEVLRLNSSDKDFFVHRSSHRSTNYALDGSGVGSSATVKMIQIK